MEILYNEDFLKIEYDKSCSCAIMHWGASPTTEQYREGNEKVLEALQIDQNPSLLIDLRALNIMMSLSDQVWTAKEWMNRVMEQAIGKLAIVVPESFVSQIAVKSIYGGLAQENLELAFFDAHDQAKEWVGGVKEETPSSSSSW